MDLKHPLDKIGHGVGVFLWSVFCGGVFLVVGFGFTAVMVVVFIGVSVTLTIEMTQIEAQLKELKLTVFQTIMDKLSQKDTLWDILAGFIGTAAAAVFTAFLC